MSLIRRPIPPKVPDHRREKTLVLGHWTLVISCYHFAMLKRGTIRLFFLTLVALSCASWIASHYNSMDISWFRWGYGGGIGLVRGEIWIMVLKSSSPDGFFGFTADFSRVSRNTTYVGEDPSLSVWRNHKGLHFSDFHLMADFGSPPQSYIGLPLWFISFLLSVASLYAWQKTRHPNRGPAFPVEVVIPPQT